MLLRKITDALNKGLLQIVLVGIWLSVSSKESWFSTMVHKVGVVYMQDGEKVLLFTYPFTFDSSIHNKRATFHLDTMK